MDNTDILARAEEVKAGLKCIIEYIKDGPRHYDIVKCERRFDGKQCRYYVPDMYDCEIENPAYDAAALIDAQAALIDELKGKAQTLLRERDAAVKDIGAIIADVELIRGTADGLEQADDEALSALCDEYCKRQGPHCFTPGDDGVSCKNFVWRGPQEEKKEA